MNYPLISEYVEAIKSAEDNFDELSYLRPVLGKDGLPIMTGGNLAVVFKMEDKQSGKCYAVKCFTREQEGRNEAYKQIAEELEYVNSTFLTPIKYLDKELFVDTNQTDKTEFPILLMDWVEGKTLDKYIHDNIENKFLLEMLAHQFCKLGMWLVSQPFAHGDLKPDNIIVKENGSLVLVDYDGMFVPSMKGQMARECGSPNFRHPMRSKVQFDEHIDDFSIALLALSLKAYSIMPELINDYCGNDCFFFSENDYTNINSTKAASAIFDLIYDKEICTLWGSFMIVLANRDISLVSSKVFSLENPKHRESYGEYIYNQARNLCNEAKDKSKIDYKKAFKLFQKAAKLGNADAQCCVGCCYKHGYGTPIDYTKSREWYDTSSQNGCARALRHIAFSYQDGFGVRKDINEALKWYEKAIDAGDIDSIVTKGTIYYYGKEGITVNYIEAARLYAIAADRGDDDGMWRLAICYENGFGVKKDYKEAFRWFEKSANKNNENGLYGLGMCYYLGNGIDKDYEIAVRLFKKAADKRQIGSLWHLGHCYEYGLGVEKNLKIAVEWYRESAKQGTSEGQWRLGYCYEKGLGIIAEKAMAKYWYVKAAKQRHKKAIEALKQLEEDDLPF